MSNIKQSKAIVIILSAPSGGGKSSIAKSLLQNDSKLVKSISVTTRPPRSQEKEGVQYFFKDKSSFEEMIVKGELLEYAVIYNNLYGTPKNYVKNKLNEGFDILFDIDYQGACQIKKKIKNCRMVSIFIMPPTLEILRKRIEDRGQDDKEAIKLRMKCAEEEISHAKNYDYTVINSNFEETVKTIQEIITKERSI